MTKIGLLAGLLARPSNGILTLITSISCVVFDGLLRQTVNASILTVSKYAIVI